MHSFIGNSLTIFNIMIDNKTTKRSKRGKRKIRKIKNRWEKRWIEEKWMELRKTIEAYLYICDLADKLIVNWLSGSHMHSFVWNIETVRYKSQLRIEQVAGKVEPKTKYILAWSDTRFTHVNSVQRVIEIHRYVI